MKDHILPNNSQEVPSSTSPSKIGVNKNIILYPILFFVAILVFAAGIFLGKFLVGPATSSQESATNQAATETKPKEYKLAGALVLKEGVVEKRTESGEWEDLAKDATINEGDIIRVGEASRAVIELDDGSAVRLNQLTEVSFSALTDEIILLTQYSGQIYHRVHPGSLVYTVKSMDTISTALGTSFSVNTDQENEITEVSVFESKVQVSVKGEETQSQEAEEGEKITVEGTEGKISLANLTTEEQNQDFYQWNNALNEGTEEEYVAETPTPSPKEEEAAVIPTTVPTSGTVHLSAAAGPEKVTLNWIFDGTAPYGFKLMKSENANPTYPPREGDQFKYLSSPPTRSYTWTGLTAGKTYHFRVGLYNGAGKITSYSADITSVPLNKTGSETGSSGTTASIDLAVTSESTGQAKLTWNVAGGNGKEVFKACYAAHVNPTYPENTCEWKGSNNKEHVFSLTSGNTYHFRVGIYANGQASNYSNNVQVTIK